MLDKQSLKQEKDYLKKVSARLEEKLEELLQIVFMIWTTKRLLFKEIY